MHRFHHLAVAAWVTVLVLRVPSPLHAVEREPSGRAAEKKSPPPLSGALESWVSLLEKDDLKAATERWTRDEQAAKALKQWWPKLKQCHKDYNYRTWLDRDPGSGGAGAGQVGEATKFTVGGHSFGHMHVVWARGDAGWRIAEVWACR